MSRELNPKKPKGRSRLGQSEVCRILVTGAAGSIGNEIVSIFKHHGHQVFGLDVKPLPTSLEVDGYLQLDLRDFVTQQQDDRRELISEVFQWTASHGLDVLVNNAAVQILGSLEDLDFRSWRTTLDVNLLAPVLLVRELLTQLEQTSGSVINISSVHARTTKPAFAAYATSKAGLSGLTRALAVELGSRVRVNAIEPASIATPMLMESFAEHPEDYQELKSFHPQLRIGTPEEVAALVYAVAFGHFRFLDGACIDLSGGLSARLHDPV